jgi:type IV pilus assembly protein PilQ
MRIRDRAGVSLLTAGLLLASAGAGLAAASQLEEVALQQQAGEATLVVSSAEALRYEVVRLSGPDRICLDLVGVEQGIEPKVAGADPSAWIQGVQHSTPETEPGNEKIVRYEIRTAGPADYTVKTEGGRLELHVQHASVLPDPKVEKPADPRALHLDMAPSLGKADPSYEVATVMIGQPSPTNPPEGGPPMSLDVQGADIRTVLRSIAEFGHVNIVPDRDVSGPMSVKLVNVPWRQALDLVCASAGLAEVDHDGVVRVALRKTLMDEELDRESTARKKEEILPLETAIIPIAYASAEELKASVAFALTKRGSIETDARTNSLLVTDIADRVAQVREMVQTLDTETRQVEIVAKLVDVDATMSRLLGIQWNVDNLHSSAERLSASISHDSPINGATTEMRIGVIRDFANIDATIQALERDNKASIVSNPSITTVNNRRARILVGKQIPLIVLDQSGNPITELKKVGITLEVTPYINSQQMITMDLHPEVSDLSSQSTVQGGIVFTTTEADTRVMVSDGETAVIGGLIRTGDTKFREGIPILSGIPILGGLFRSSDTRDERRELLIFVTPRIVRGMASQER